MLYAIYVVCREHMAHVYINSCALAYNFVGNSYDNLCAQVLCRDSRITERKNHLARIPEVYLYQGNNFRNLIYVTCKAKTPYRNVQA